MNDRRQRWGWIVGLMVLATTGVVAQPAAAPDTASPPQSEARGPRHHPDDKPGMHGLRRADVNADGVLTRAELEEFERAQQARRARHFAVADRDHDGRLTPEEWRAYRPAAPEHTPRTPRPGRAHAAPERPQSASEPR